jgi:hypothetical protein
MARTFTASDRKNLIRLASTMPKGSPERRAILAGLKKTKKAGLSLDGPQALRDLLRRFFDMSAGSPSDVPSSEKRKIQGYLEEMIAEGYALGEGSLEALAMGDEVEFNRLEGLLRTPLEFDAISEILGDYWDA